MPVGDVLVGNAGSNVKHDDAALTVDVVAISETTELLLTGGVPDIEGDRAVVLCGCQSLRFSRFLFLSLSLSMCVYQVCTGAGAQHTVVKPRG